MNRKAFRGLLKRWGEKDPERVRIVPSWYGSNLFAQDNGKTGALPDGRKALLIPGSRNRQAEEKDLQEEIRAAEGFGIPALRSGLLWDGGNVLFDGTLALVGANTVAENMIRLEKGEDEVLALLEAEFGVGLTILGEVGEAVDILQAERAKEHPARPAEAGQADFHIDLDVALLGPIDGHPTAILADPRAGLSYLPAVLEKKELFEDHYLSPQDMKAIFRDDLQISVETREPRLAAYREILTNLGYRVVGVPDLRLMDERNHLGRVNTRFNYCNVLPGALESRPSAVLFSYGIEGLDEAVFQILRRLGVDPLPLSPDGVTPGELLSLGGGVHCLCSRLE